MQSCALLQLQGSAWNRSRPSGMGLVWLHCCASMEVPLLPKRSRPPADTDLSMFNRAGCGKGAMSSDSIEYNCNSRCEIATRVSTPVIPQRGFPTLRQVTPYVGFNSGDLFRQRIPCLRTRSVLCEVTGLIPVTFWENMLGVMLSCAINKFPISSKRHEDEANQQTDRAGSKRCAWATLHRAAWGAEGSATECLSELVRDSAEDGYVNEKGIDS